MDTIALITSYLLMTIVAFIGGQTELGAVFIMTFGVVMFGEYASLKKNGKTISKKYSKSMPKIKVSLATLMGLTTASLIWHLLS